MINVSVEELKKLSHTFCEDLRGRIFPLYALWNGNKEWVLWFPDNKGSLTEFKPVELVEGNYFSKSPVSSQDIIFPFLEFLEKQASWPEIHNFTERVTNNLHNLSASIEKIDILFKYKVSTDNNVSRMIATELEYFFLTCKSLFDLLQCIISKLWEKVDLTNKQQLPREFSKLALQGDRINSIGNIIEKYKIPPELAKIYNSHAPFFIWLRTYRVKISHGVGESKLVFLTEKGPAISCKENPFKDMSIWTKTNKLNNNLGAVISAISHIVLRTLGAFNDAINFFKTKIRFPADVVPGYRMYTRIIYGKHLTNLEDKILHPW